MIEVFPKLYVGNDIDWRKHVSTPSGEPKEGWAVVHACKEPYHREALGYTGMGGPRDDPEYLFALRGERLCLNMVDAPKPEFFSPKMIDAALAFIGERLDAGKKVLVHCNQGVSRSPSLALLYMRRNGPAVQKLDLQQAVEAFMVTYPSYQPGKGIAAYLEKNWG